MRLLCVDELVHKSSSWDHAIYHAWGERLTVAHDLAEAAGPGAVFVGLLGLVGIVRPVSWAHAVVLQSRAAHLKGLRGQLRACTSRGQRAETAGQSLGSERAVSESRRWKGQARSAKLAKAWIIRSSNL